MFSTISENKSKESVTLTFSDYVKRCSIIKYKVMAKISSASKLQSSFQMVHLYFFCTLLLLRFHKIPLLSKISSADCCKIMESLAIGKIIAFCGQ